MSGNDNVMITDGVSASTNTDEHFRIPRFKCFLLKKVLIYVSFTVLFLAVALAVAIVYTGKENFQSGDKRQIFEASKAVNIKKYPFLAAVFSVKPHFFLCSALILNERYLLTSANCFTVLFPNILVRTASTVWTKGGAVYEVEKFMIHEEYDNTNFQNNIAVIKLKEDIIFIDSKVEVAAIRESRMPLEGEATVVGWGNFHWQLFEVALHECYEYVCIPAASVCDTGLSGIVVVYSECVAIWSLGNIEENKGMNLTEIAPYKKWIQAKIKD